MSNKTQLSTNNTKLASLIQELANKAAGGGSGAGTCAVELDLSSYNSTQRKNGALFYTQPEGYIVAQNIHATETLDTTYSFNAKQGSSVVVIIGSVTWGGYIEVDGVLYNDGNWTEEHEKIYSGGYRGFIVTIPNNAQNVKIVSWPD